MAGGPFSGLEAKSGGSKIAAIPDSPAWYSSSTDTHLGHGHTKFLNCMWKFRDTDFYSRTY
jgi:hypothetical protein